MALPQAAPNTTPPSKPIIPLDIYFNNAWYAIVIQEADDIAELVIKRDISPDFKAIYDVSGQPLTFSQYHDFISQLRDNFANRQLVSQETVVDADAEGKAGTVGHTATFSALRDGKVVTVTAVAVVQVEWDEKLQKRQFVMESLVTKISSA